MDYEKKYKEALERVRRLHDRMLVLSSTDALVASSELEFIFPELKESEDEKIRKGIIEIIKAVSGPDCDVYLNEKKQEKYLAWLEKQKEQKHPDGCFTCDEYKKGYEAGRLHGFTAGYNKAMKEQKPDTRDADDLQLLGFIYDLLNDEIEWKDNWAMSKDECLRRLNNYRPQAKQGWSEEDEKMMESIIRVLLQASTHYSMRSPSTMQVIATNDYQGEIAWLKSLRPSWKPSEEQMKALEAATVRYQSTGLESLYEELKKL